MPSSQFTDPRLAVVYDTLNPRGASSAFYLSLAGSTRRRILDIGCGSGRLACDLAERGHQVTGADPSRVMLEIARARPGGKAVSWIEAGAADLTVDTRFDLIIMTGHAFQVLLADAVVAASLSTLRRHLAPAGRLAFETRNPAVREWETWTPAETRQRVEPPGLGSLEVHNDIRLVAWPLVTYETHFRWPSGDSVVAVDTLRFMDRPELSGFLAAAGFGEVAWYGDWDLTPFEPSSPEIIAVATAIPAT